MRASSAKKRDYKVIHTGHERPRSVRNGVATHRTDSDEEDCHDGDGDERFHGCPEDAEYYEHDQC